MSAVLQLIIPESGHLLPALLADPRARETLPGFHGYCAKAAASPAQTEDPYGAVARLVGVAQEAGKAFPHAAYSRYARNQQAVADVWMTLSPVQYTSASSGLILHPIDPNQWSQGEIDQLTDLLQSAAAGTDISVEPGARGTWLVRAGQHLELATVPLHEVRDRPVALHLPAGEGATYWARWLAECEMILHHHALNRKREQRGLLPVSGFWLWGEGQLPAGTVADSSTQLLTADPALQGMALYHGCGSADFCLSGLDPDAASVVAADFTLVTSPRSAGELVEWLAGLDVAWLQPALRMLAEKQLSSVQLVDPIAGIAWRLNRLGLKKFWRTRPVFTSRT